MHLFVFQILPVVIVILSALLFVLRTRRRRNERENVLPRPPGPLGLPVIGNLHQFVFSCPHLYFHELSKIHGPLLSLKLGSVPILVVSSARLAKQVLKTQDLIFSNRPKLATLKKLSYGGLDISFAPHGDHWRQFKKVSLIHLFSHKKVRSFAPFREEEVHLMTRKISSLSEEDKIVNLSEMLMCLTSTIICKIAFGRRFDMKSVKYGRSFHHMLTDANELFISFCFSDYFPSMGWLLDNLTGISTRLHKVFMEFDEFYEEIIDQHLNSTGTAKARQEDIVDTLLELQRETSLGINITKDHIKAILMNIFNAGTDTSAATVILAMTELIKNPKAMKKAQQEVRSLMENRIKDNIIIKEEDVEKLVYLKAVVKETMRLHPVVPLLLPRETTQKCTIQGYEIQEKTLVYVNAWTIGRDPRSWNTPEEFAPERFLNKSKEIEFQGQDFELIPFGSGRRMCPGIKMGVAMVDVSLANLICLFDWEVPIGTEKQVFDTSVLPGLVLHKKNPLCLVAKKAFG